MVYIYSHTSSITLLAYNSLHNAFCLDDYFISVNRAPYIGKLSIFTQFHELLFLLGRFYHRAILPYRACALYYYVIFIFLRCSRPPFHFAAFGRAEYWAAAARVGMAHIAAAFITSPQLLCQYVAHCHFGNTAKLTAHCMQATTPPMSPPSSPFHSASSLAGLSPYIHYAHHFYYSLIWLKRHFIISPYHAYDYQVYAA